MRDAGWLCVVEDRSRWGVTSKPFDLGMRAAGSDELRAVGQPFVQRLRDQVDETVHLSVRSSGSLVIVLREDSHQALRTFVELGTRAPLHATSSGLAVLAALPDDDVERCLERELDAHTASTIVDRGELRAEVQRTRARGYAVNDASWWRAHVNAVGAAIVTRAGRPAGAVAVSIPASRFDADRTPALGALVRRTTGEIAAALGV